MNIIILGKPGSGKGTQAKMLAKKYKLNHFSTGELFRKHLKENTELGKKIKLFMNSPNLVPDEIVNEVVKQEVENRNHDNILFDGFPRTLNQAEFLDKILKKPIDHVALLEVSDRTAIKRIQKRQKLDPRTESNTSEKIIERITEFKRLTNPIIEKYKKENKLKIINGESPIKEVSKKISI